MAVFFWLISGQTAISFVPGPSIHTGLYATFLEVKKRVPEDSVLLTWWDYDHTLLDLGFFTLLLKEQTELLSLIIVVLGLALTISTVDTLVNAISSLFIVDGKATFNLDKKTDYLKLSKYFIIFLSLIAFIIASRGFDILYLFLLADLFCCAFVLTVFYSFYNNRINEKTAYMSIVVGLIGGFLMFPFPDFSKSLLVGILMPKDMFTPFIAQSLLFLSFVVATFLPAIILKIKKT